MGDAAGRSEDQTENQEATDGVPRRRRKAGGGRVAKGQAQAQQVPQEVLI